MVADHMDLVRGIAVQVRKSVGNHCELDELIALGAAGLLESARRYDPGRGIPFPIFARIRVRGAMYDGLRKMKTLPRWGRHTGQDHDPAAGAAHEWSNSLSSDRDEVWVTAPSEVWTLAGGELVDPRAQRADELLMQKHMQSKVHEALAALPAVEQHIIRSCYFENKTMREAGEELGLSRSWSSRLHARAVAHLRALMEHTEHL